MNDLDAVRKRPGMYIGPIDDGSGLHNMVYEIVNNAINEALAGHATEVTVTLNADRSCTVRDDGRGLPTAAHAHFGVSTAEVVMTQLHAGVSLHSHDLPNRRHGVGVCVVNALSEWLDLRIWRDGKEHQMRFRGGDPETRLRVAGDARGMHGTEVTFRPSTTIFGETAFDHATLERRLSEFAQLKSGVTIKLVDARGSAHRGTDRVPPGDTITIGQFAAVDIRIGTIVAAETFPEARKPALKLVIDFGPEIGRKKSSAQITEHYRPEELIGRQVCAVVNFPARQIGPFKSEVLTLGFHDESDHVVLINADKPVPNGRKLL